MLKVWVSGLFALWTVTGSLAAQAGNVYAEATAPVAGRVYDTVIRTQDADELRYVVLRELTNRYADAKGITVSDDEIDA